MAKRRSPKPAKRSARTRARRTAAPKAPDRIGNVTVTEVEELDALRRDIERAAGRGSPLRWNPNPDEVQRSVMQLVLTLVEFIRRVLERQAIRRMEAGTLNDAETENIGRALMQLETTIRDLAASVGIGPDELNLDLGPLGKLM